MVLAYCCAAHHIRNRYSQIFKAASAVASRSKWCLTGTPLHNSLDDYGALLGFLGFPLLMHKSQFDRWVTVPIKEKRPNSFNTLANLIRATCLRRTKDMVQDSLKLPSKLQRTMETELHDSEKALYEFFKKRTVNVAAGLVRQSNPEVSEGKSANTVTLLNFLRRICNGGEDLLPHSALEAWKSKSSDSVDWQMMRGSNQKCDSCASSIVEADSKSDDFTTLDCQHTICAPCLMQADDTTADGVERCPKCAATRASPGNESSCSEASILYPAKIEALMRNLVDEQAAKQNGAEVPVIKR